MKTFIWILLKTIQGLGLITVISGLYYGMRDHDMNYELLMLLLSHQTLFHYFLINNGVNSCTSGDLKIPRDSFSFNNVLIVVKNQD